MIAGAVMTGAAGNTTAFVVPSWHPTIGLTALAGVEPQLAVSLYLAFIVQHPFMFVSNALA